MFVQSQRPTITISSYRKTTTGLFGFNILDLERITVQRMEEIGMRGRKMCLEE